MCARTHLYANIGFTQSRNNLRVSIRPTLGPSGACIARHTKHKLEACTHDELLLDDDELEDDDELAM